MHLLPTEVAHTCCKICFEVVQTNELCLHLVTENRVLNKQTTVDYVSTINRVGLNVMYLVVFQVFQQIEQVNFLQLGRQKHILLLQLVGSLQPLICLNIKARRSVSKKGLQQILVCSVQALTMSC